MENIRQSFLKYFKSKGHTVVPSDSLIPSSDPSLLFTSAGMVQFKPHFLQQIPLTFTRAASSQRCIRTTDIDQVGLTPRHLTLFEMLGNFSFGDYFKEEAIAWGWDFLTKELGLSKERLWPTVFTDDDEAFTIWKKFVPESKITRLGEETNFWTMGPTGPCGPSSEIYWDLENKSDGGRPDDSNRWMEIWNLVFTQFDKQPNGDLNSLPNKNIDTGMGLERLMSVVENANGNFNTSLFKPLIQFTEEAFKYKLGSDPKKDITVKVVADHLRAVSLLVCDGILPSNEGRGYVLRRLLRRALRQGSLHGVNHPFLFKGVPLITDMFQETAGELKKREESIAEIIRQEEERFLETLETGSLKLNELVTSTIQAKKKSITGLDVFKLYDTYGFPPELTHEILIENKLSFDSDEFEKAKSAAQDMAREGWKGSGAKDVSIYNNILKKTGASKFDGYDKSFLTNRVVAIILNGAESNELKKGQTGEILTAVTPFYPEGGGQVGDTGWIKTADGKNIIAHVLDTQKPAPNIIVHTVKTETALKINDEIVLEIDLNNRRPTQRHHTATHLLHAALRKLLGNTVTQAGSLVEPNRLRFDYTYNKPLTKEQIMEVENVVNNAVLENYPVTPKIFSAKDAKTMGAMALFGEKYGDEVRCLLISNKSFKEAGEAFSLELCGGTHVSATGDIGGFKIISDSSLASGVRRMEAVAGNKTIEYLRMMEQYVGAITSKLKSTPQEIENRITKLLESQKKLEEEVRELKLKLAQGSGAAKNGTTSDLQIINEIPLAIKVSDGLDVKDLRTLADRLKDQHKSAVVFVASSVEDEGKVKISFIFTVSKDMQLKGIKAGDLAKKAAEVLGGSGGGRPDFAQGGGQGKDKLVNLVNQLPSFFN